MMTGTPAIAAADGGEDFEAVDAGHFDVEEDEVGVEALEGGEPRFAAGSSGDDLDGGLRLENHAQQAAHDGRVIDKEDANFAGEAGSLVWVMARRLPPCGACRRGRLHRRA